MEIQEAIGVLTEHLKDFRGPYREYGDLNKGEKKVSDAITMAVSALLGRDLAVKIVVAEHIGGCKRYLLSVPKDKDVNEGDTVIVKSKTGEVTMKCVCDSFAVGKGVLNTLAAKYGATLPLATVIGIMQPEWW